MICGWLRIPPWFDISQRQINLWTLVCQPPPIAPAAPAGGPPAADSAPADRPPGPSPGIEPPEIWALEEDAAGAIWVAIGRDALYRISPARDTVDAFVGIRFQPPAPERPMSDLFTALSIAPDGGVWLGYQHGVVSRMDPDTERFAHYHLGRSRPGAPAPAWVEAIHVTDAGIAWAATRDGLWRVDPQRGDVRRFAQAEGLPTVLIASILQAPEGALWLGTQRGLVRFEPTSGVVNQFGVADGIRVGAFQAGAAW